MNKKPTHGLLYPVIFAVLFSIGAPCAIGQTPGLTNPTSFVTYDPQFYWSGQVGIKMGVAPNAATGVTGSCFALNPGDTCHEPSSWGSGFEVITPKLPGIKYGDLEELDTISGCYNSSGWVSYDGDTSLQMDPERHFRIMLNTETRTPDNPATVGMDPYTQYRLPYCPPGFTNSIRIGNLGGGTESDALYYTMHVDQNNAMLIIHYACVIEDPGGGGHGPKDDPVFIIRVMKQDGSNWVQVSDTMCYMQPSTACSNSQAIEGQCIDTSVHSSGWYNNPLPGSTYYKTYWKDWSKVAVSLNQYIYEDVRIEIYVGDCAYSQHFGYAYIAGESQPMALKGQGCPVGESTAADTLTAPAGLNNYIFYKQISTNNPTSNFNPLGQTFVDSTGFQTVHTKDADGYDYYWQRIDRSSTSSTNNRFALEQEDFLNADGRTYAGTKNFMCKMRSFMDPIKPITSFVYTTVAFKKPVALIDSVLSCDKKITLINMSESYNDNTQLDHDSTYWVKYEDPNCTVSTGDTLRGDTVEVTFPSGGRNGISLYVKTLNTGTDTMRCYTIRKMALTILEEPKTKIWIDDSSICENQEAVLKDNTYPNNEDSVYRRIWRFEGVDTLTYDKYTFTVDENTGEIDTVDNSATAEHYKTHRRGFDIAEVPIELDIYNGYFYVIEGDTTWCHTVAYDTIRVFKNPKLNVEGDSIVCKGQYANLDVSAEDSSYTYSYQWSETNGSITGDLAAGANLHVKPTKEKTTYYVKVTNQENCVAWTNYNVYLVIPKINIIDDSICPGESTMLYGTKAHHYSWTSSPTDASLGGQESEDTIIVSPEQTTIYTMTGHGGNNCDADTLQRKVTVVPLPTLTVQTDPGIIDSEDPTVTFRDVSPGSYRTLWYMGDGTDLVSGNEVEYTFGETYDDTVYVTMFSANVLGCFDSVTFPMPVVQFTAWTPNIFTPSLETNNRFGLYTINEYEYFTIYIYDRRGRLMYEADDVHFEWDGRDLNGNECPQGAYVWVMRYRRPGTSDIVTRKGSITILR